MRDLTKEDREKLAEKNSFLIQKSLRIDVKEMGFEETSIFINSVFDYVYDGDIPDLSESKYRFVRAAFNRFKEAYISDSKKWLETCRKKSKAKVKEWQERNHTSNTDESGNSLSHPDFP